MNYWLAKQEPSGPRGYNILQLQKDKKTKKIQRLGIITNFSALSDACSKNNLGQYYKDVSKIIVLQ